MCTSCDEARAGVRRSGSRPCSGEVLPPEETPSFLRRLPRPPSSNSSGKARHVARPSATGRGRRVQSIVAAISFSPRAHGPIRTAFWTAGHAPRARTGRERDLRHGRLPRSSSSWREGSVTPVLCRTAVQNDTYFAKLVSLGCHDVRHAARDGARLLPRRWSAPRKLAPPADRYIEMIGEGLSRGWRSSSTSSLWPRRIEGRKLRAGVGANADTLALARGRAESGLARIACTSRRRRRDDLDRPWRPSIAESVGV